MIREKDILKMKLQKEEIDFVVISLLSHEEYEGILKEYSFQNKWLCYAKHKLFTIVEYHEEGYHQISEDGFEFIKEEGVYYEETIAENVIMPELDKAL